MSRAWLRISPWRIWKPFQRPADERDFEAAAKAARDSIENNEPEAGLDPMAVDNLRQAVRALRDRGAVVLVVTHGAKGWQQVADQELRLAADGRWACGWLHDAAPSAA